MHTTPDTSHRFAAVAHLCEETQRIANHVVARARAARRLGVTVEAYRLRASALDYQAWRDEGLLFGETVRILRAAAAANRLIAEALEAIENGEGV